MTELVKKALAHLLAQATLDLPAEKEGHRGELQPLCIHLDSIPADLDDAAAYPCLVIRWLGSEDREDGWAVETFDVLVCVYAQAGRDVSESWASVVAARVRRVLRETDILENRYQRTGSVTVTNPKLDPDARHFTHHALAIRCAFKYPQPGKPIIQEA